MTIDTSREAVEQINEELSWDNSFGAIELINALLAERDAALAERDRAMQACEQIASRLDTALAEVARLSTPPDDAEVAELVNRLMSYAGEVWEVGECYNGTREEAADALTRLSHAHAARRKE